MPLVRGKPLIPPFPGNASQFETHFLPYEKKVQYMREPTFSPWGEVQACETLYPGIYLITAPGHGGILVDSESVLLLTSAARKCGFQDGGYLCFEEDGCEQVVLRELLDRKLWKIPDRVTDPIALEKAINDSLREYQPEYWAAREKFLHRPKTPKKKITNPAR